MQWEEEGEDVVLDQEHDRVDVPSGSMTVKEQKVGEAAFALSFGQVLDEVECPVIEGVLGHGAVLGDSDAESIRIDVLSEALRTGSWVRKSHHVWDVDWDSVVWRKTVCVVGLFLAGMEEIWWCSSVDAVFGYCIYSW